MHNNLNIALNQFIAIETLLEPTARRTQRVNLTRENLLGIQNAIDDNNEHILTKNALLKYAPNIVEHSTMADSVVIPYGWDERRLIFILSYSEPIPGGVKLVYIQGYTDYYDRSYTGKIDPNTKFYFNSIIEVSDITNRMGHRTVKVTNAFKTVYNPISNEYKMERDYEFLNMHTDNDLQVLRPNDIALSITNRVNELGNNFISNNKYDNSIKAVDMNDELGTHLVTNVVNQYRNAVDDVSSFRDMNTQLNAISYLSGVSPYTITLLGELRNNRSLYGYGDIDITYATLEELETIFPNLLTSNVSQIIEAVDPHQSLTAIRGYLQSDGIEDNRRETRIHAITSEFATGLATIMLNNTITKMTMVLSNYYVDGLEQYGADEVYYTILDARSIVPGLDIQRVLRNLIQDVVINLVPSVTSNNTVDTHIVAVMDLFGVSYLEVTFDDMEPMIIPFSDAVSSLYAPSIMHSATAEAEIDKFETIITETV